MIRYTDEVEAAGYTDPTPKPPWWRCQEVKEHSWPVGDAWRSWSTCRRLRWHRRLHHERIVRIP